jgi:hypothetical protein
LGSRQPSGGNSSHLPHSQSDKDVDTPQRPSLPSAQSLGSATGGASEESSEDVSRSSSRRPRRSIARPSYAQNVEDDEDDSIAYKKSSAHKRSGRAAKAPATYESDFEDEASEHQFEVESEEESQGEESDPESAEDTEDGYDSGVKLKGKGTNKKSNGAAMTTASAKQNASKTGKGTSKGKGYQQEEQWRCYDYGVCEAKCKQDREGY